MGYKGRRLLSILIRQSWSGCSATCSMKMSFWGHTESVLFLVIIWIIRFRFGLAIRNTKCSTCRPNQIPECSEGTPTGGVRSGCPSMCLIIRGLLNLYGFYGDEFKVQCPTGSGRYMTLFEVAKEIERRLASAFLRDATGRGRSTGERRSFRTTRTGAI